MDRSSPTVTPGTGRRQLLPQTRFLEFFLEYVHSFRYRALRPTFTGPVFLRGSSDALGKALPLLSVEAFTICCSYSPSSPFPEEYLPAPGAEIAIWTGVVARTGW